MTGKRAPQKSKAVPKEVRSDKNNVAVNRNWPGKAGALCACQLKPLTACDCQPGKAS